MAGDSDLQAVRSRLVAAALAERRKIERALHDGVQQDLIALSVELQLARALVTEDPDSALVSLDRIRQELGAALGRVQKLAGEIYPAVLDVRGLTDALRQAARASDAAATVERVESKRYPAEVEAAVFFLWRTVLDALDPSAEARIWVREEDEGLHVMVEAATAVDPVRSRDIVEAAGGVLAVDTDRACCKIRARFPLGQSVSAR